MVRLRSAQKQLSEYLDGIAFANHERNAATVMTNVVVHALCHLVQKNHTPEFWSPLGKAMPDYERRREELRKLGPRLEW